MPFDAPFMLGPFSVDAIGRLEPIDHGAMPAFLFRWRGRLVRARFSPDGASRGTLLLRTVLGRVPSTATPHEGDRRPQAFQLLHLLPPTLPAGWRMLLLPDHGVRLEADTLLTLPITATDLVVELTRFLLAVAPYLDVLEAAGVVGLSAEAGTENT